MDTDLGCHYSDVFDCYMYFRVDHRGSLWCRYGGEGCSWWCCEDQSRHPKAIAKGIGLIMALVEELVWS